MKVAGEEEGVQLNGYPVEKVNQVEAIDDLAYTSGIECTPLVGDLGKIT